MMNGETNPPTRPWAAIRDRLVALRPREVWMLCGALSALIIISGSLAAVSISGPPPPPVELPGTPAQDIASTARNQSGYYLAIVQEDLKTLNLPPASLDQLKAANAHRVEFSGRQRLRIGRHFRTSSIQLSALRKHAWIGESGQGMRAAHIALRISNRSSDYLAYRIITSVRGTCETKGTLQHNALVLKPKERIIRTECVLRSAKGSLVINRVEVMNISALGYHYLSRLEPIHVQSDPRTSEGHHFGKMSPCSALPWREIKEAMASKSIQWRDVIDFYSRHNCDEYTFFTGYHWTDKSPIETLPARPPSETR